MNTLLVGSVILVVIASAGFGQKKTVPETLSQTLIKLEMQSWEAWKDRDGKFYETFLSDDHVEVGGSGVDKKSSIVAFVGSPVCVIKSYSASDFHLTVLNPATALLTYHAQQDSTCGGKPVPSAAWVSSLYIKRGKRWLNAFYQQTPASK